MSQSRACVIEDDEPVDQPAPPLSEAISSSVAELAQAPKQVPAAQSGVHVKKTKAAFLASGYTMKKRIMETVSLVLWIVLNLYVSYRVLSISNIARDSWLVVLALLTSMVAADFFSGMVHWACDTWGTVETPVFSAFIRSFREHHVDPMAITRHDYIEANGDTCLLTIPVLILLSLVKINFAHTGELFIFTFLAGAAFWVAITNQIHKWSHTLRPPSYVQFLQDSNFILSRKVHNIHHQQPFDRYYCITTGWLNPIFNSVNYWGTMEAAIEYFSDNHPREDDVFWTSSQIGLEKEE